MSEHWSDEHLDAVLAEVGANLETEPKTEVRPIRSSRRAAVRVYQVMALAAAVLVAVALVVAPVRRAVADWLGIGGTQIERVPEDEADTEGLPPLEADVEPITPEAAAAEVSFPLPDVGRTELGPPDQVARPPEGGVLYLWDRDNTTLWIRDLDMPVDERRRKIASLDSDIRPVEDLGEAALMLEGSHVLATPDRQLASDSVVVWLRGGLELRLESDLDIEVIVEIARSMDRGSR